MSEVPVDTEAKKADVLTLIKLIEKIFSQKWSDAKPNQTATSV